MKRILLKISGEGLSDTKNCFSFEKINCLIKNISYLHQKNIQIAIVIGAGNLFRGGQQIEIERQQGDHIGMLGTMMNALVLKNYFEKNNLQTNVMAPFPYTPSIDRFSIESAHHKLNKKHIVIFAGGTGSPFFTTDTASVLRALELNCDTLLKGTNVDGIYDKDPKHYPNAKFYQELTYDFVIKNNLNVMDMTAFTLAKEHKLPIIIFDLFKPHSIESIVNKTKKFTTVS